MLWPLELLTLMLNYVGLNIFMNVRLIFASERAGHVTKARNRMLSYTLASL
jgi:hypothetical protein